jgi:hypothetical protein
MTQVCDIVWSISTLARDLQVFLTAVGAGSLSNRVAWIAGGHRARAHGVLSVCLVCFLRCFCGSVETSESDIELVLSTVDLLVEHVWNMFGTCLNFKLKAFKPSWNRRFGDSFGEFCPGHFLFSMGKNHQESYRPHPWNPSPVLAGELKGALGCGARPLFRAASWLCAVRGGVMSLRHIKTLVRHIKTHESIWVRWGHGWMGRIEFLCFRRFVLSWEQDDFSLLITFLLFWS